MSSIPSRRVVCDRLDTETMEIVRKIGENVFLISWTTKNKLRDGHYGRQLNNETTVKIAEIFQSCQLVSKFDPSSYETILEVDIRPFPLAAEGGKYQMLKPKSVLVINSGFEQSMEFQNSKWSATLPRYECECGSRLYSSNNDKKLKIHILIEFISTLMETETKHVMDHLLTLWETKTLADVTFKFKEKEVKAHTLIIASGSPVLAAMFQNDFKEKQERIVTIKDTKTAVFEKMLRFFYTGDADLNIADANDLLIVANQYGVDSLKEECAFYLSQYLSEVIVTKEDWVDLMKNFHGLSLAAVPMMVLTKNKLAPAEKLKQRNSSTYNEPCTV